MKELSIEEKAKRYDEALKYAMIYYKDGNEDMKTMMKTCFPVLVEESEDERIRKDIVFYIAAHHKDDGEKARWLAWLEKQGKNMGISEATKKKLEDNLNKALEKETPESWNEFLEKQGEQKSAEWSEKDEDTLHCIIDALDSLDIRTNTNGEHENHTEEIYWLKSLKDRVQPKQEWSGGDEAHLHSLITHLEQWIESNPDTTGADIQGENVAWLKSLRPQNTWKPCDYELEVLRLAAEKDGTCLMGLYEQLKKLREE